VVPLESAERVDQVGIGAAIVLLKVQARDRALTGKTVNELNTLGRVLFV
jgi:hypothetical protein